MTAPADSRVLFVTPVSPFRTAAGSEQRSHLMLQALRQHYTVDVLELSEGSDLHASAASHTDGLVHMTLKVPANRQVWRRFDPQQATTALAAQGLGRALGDYRMVVGRYLWPVTQLHLPQTTRLVVDLDDWHFRMAPPAWRDADAVKTWLRKSVARKLAERALKRVHSAFAVSAADCQEISRRLPCTLLPNVSLHSPTQAEAMSSSPRLLFVGSLWYRPNAQAIDWFLTRVWPRVRLAVPSADLRVIGDGPAGLRARWAQHPGVSAPGFAKALEDEYAQASVVIAPILSGGGSNIKVVEALLFRRPCVVTPLVSSAFHPYLIPNQHFVCAGASKDFADRCIEMLSDAERARQIGSSGHRQAAEVFSIGRFRKTLLGELQLIKQGTPVSRKA